MSSCRRSRTGGRCTRSDCGPRLAESRPTNLARRYRLTPETPTTLAPGTRLGSYEIVAPLGAGGMGEVYRASDTKLARDVAIKILPQAFASDHDRLARFHREAKTLAALNHPHIAQIYGLETADGVHALVMELVDGETLAARIARGPLAVAEALEIATQVASALQAAHLKGIIHRDLKPANVIVGYDGRAKVLDFGLARPVEASASATTGSPTITSPAMTQPGMILGTAAYMSPEQAKGRTADRRADVWAFGCVLYEMLTGRRAFDGEDVTDVIGAIMRAEPDWTSLPAGLPAAAGVFLRRCLEKDANRRVQDIGDVRLALEGAFDVPERPQTSGRSSAAWRSPAWMGAGVLLVAAAAAAGAWILKPAPPVVSALVRRLTIPALPGALHVATNNRDLTISRDGSLIVYFAGQGQERQIVVRRLDSLEPTPLRPAERFFEPTISPDNQWVAFNDESDFTLRKIRITGGPLITIAKVNEQILGATWEGDTIVYATVSGLWQVPAAGGTPSSLTRPDLNATGIVHAWPAFVSGGRAVLYVVQNRLTGSSAIAVLDLRSGDSKVLLEGGTNPRVTSRHLLYSAEGTIHAVPFDAARLSLSGTAIPLVTGVLSKSAGGVDFDAASDGTLIYVPGTGVARRQLTWVQENGTRRPVGAPERSYAVARLSPDGRRAALEIREQDSDIWIWDFFRSTLTRFTTDPAFDGYPVWSHDGRRLFFASARRGASHAFSQLADGTGEAQQLTDGRSPTPPVSLARDGSALLIEGSSSSLDILVLPLQPPGTLKPVLATRFNEVNAEVSPNGRWIAYQSDESGRNEIFVRPWPNADSGKWQVSTGGGRHAAWSTDGRQLFYLEREGRLVRVPVHGSTTFEAGPASIVVSTPFYAGSGRRSYDVSPDGSILLIENTPDTNVSSSSIVVVFNWTEDLERARPR